MRCRIIPLFAAVASVPMLFGATPLSAQEVQRWTLEECIAYAFEHNIEVKQAELDVQTKRLTRSDAGWAYAPDISASSSYSFSSGRVLDPTTYEFVEHQSVNGTSTSVGASVTLFNGMRNLHNLERSRLDLRAALLGVEKARNDIRLNITAYYLEILCAEENIRNAEQTVETLKIQEEKTRKSVEAGKVTSADLLQIRSQLANAENTLLSARNSYDIARLNICQLLEIEDYTTFHTVAPSDNILGDTPMPVSTDALLASAQQLPEVESARLGIDIARRDLRIARSSYYPTLSLSAGYGSSYSDARQKMFMNPDGTYRYEAYPLAEQYKDNASSYISVSLNVPIFGRLTTAQRPAAEDRRSPGRVCVTHYGEAGEQGGYASTDRFPDGVGQVSLFTEIRRLGRGSRPANGAKVQSRSGYRRRLQHGARCAGRSPGSTPASQI